MSRPPLALLTVVATTAVLVAVGNTTTPGPARVAARDRTLEPVVGALAICPELLQAGGDVQTRLTAGTARQGPLLVRAASIEPKTGSGPPVLVRGGEVGAFGLPGNTAVAVAATATGALAGTVEAEQVSRGADGIQRGLAGVRCEPVSQDTWFVGGSTRVGAETDLILVNPYNDTALVDVRIFGTSANVPDEPIAFTVKPRSRVRIDLEKHAPEEEAVSLHITVREGRVSPAVRDARRGTTTPLGADWVPRAGYPAYQVDIGGIPEANASRWLYLLAPGEDDATVRVQAFFGNEQLVAPGLEEIEVPAGRVKAVSLQPLGGRTAALRVASEGAPVLASVFNEQKARFNPIREFAYVSATRPLTGPTLVTEGRSAPEVRTVIILSAPDAPGEVTVSAFPVRGRKPKPVSKKFAIPQGRLVAVLLRGLILEDGLQPVLVTPTPGKGPVYATRAIVEQGRRGPLLTVLSLETKSGEVPVGAVRRDPRVSLINPKPDQ